MQLLNKYLFQHKFSLAFKDQSGILGSQVSKVILKYSNSHLPSTHYSTKAAMLQA